MPPVRDPYQQARDRYPWAYTNPPTSTRRQAAAALGSALLLTVILGGIPTLLLHTVGWPPVHLAHTSLNDVRWYITSGQWADPETWIGGLTTATWIVWAALVLDTARTVLDTTIRLVRRLPPRHTSSPTRAATRILVGVLLAVVLAADHRLTARSSPHPGPALQPVPPAVLAHAAAAPAAHVTLVPPSPLPTVGITHSPSPTPPGPTRPSWAGNPPPMLIANTSPTTEQRYRVQRGDTLWGIAAAHLGDPMRWPQIWALNHDRLQPDGTALTDPDLIQPGWTLTLPAASSPSPPAQPRINGRAAPPPATSPPTQPQHHQATPPPNHQPAPRSSHNTGKDWPLHGLLPQTGPGVWLRSGSYLALGLAVALAAALAIHRHRHPSPRSEPDQAEAGGGTRRVLLDELAAAHIPTTGTWLSAAPALPDRHGTPATLPTATDLHGHTLDLTALAPHGCGLIGPGALAALRGVAAAVLTAGGPYRVDDNAELIIPADDLTRLLDDAPIPHHPRITVTTDLADALDHLDHRLVTRARLLERHAATSTADLQARVPDEQPLPPLVLIATPDDAHRVRLRAMLALGAPLGVRAVLHGTWTRDATIHLDIHGNPERDHEGTEADARWSRLNAAELSHLVQITADTARDQEAELDQPPAAALPHHPTPSGDSADHADAVDTSAPLPHPEPEHPKPSKPRLGLRVVGGTDLYADEQPITTGVRTLARQLLVLLAVHPDGLTSAQIRDAIWDGAPPPGAAGNLRTATSHLRGQLRTTTGDPDTDPLTYTGQVFTLDPDHITVDLWNLNAALHMAEHTADAAQRDAAWRTITDLYSGPLGGDAAYAWIEPDREHLRLRVADALTRYAERLQPNDPSQAITALAKATTVDPYNQAVYRRLMRLQASQGRPDSVARTLDLLRDRLAIIDDQPDPTTLQLAHHLASSDQ
jgi:DNA-binding SARP family transcriptional activator/LysM repeat protein